MTQFVTQSGVKQAAFSDLSGSIAGSQMPALTEWITPWGGGQGRAVSGTTAYDLCEIYIPGVLTFTKMSVIINTGDGAHNYSWGLYTTAGALLASNTATNVGAFAGSLERSNAEGSVTVNPGNYLITVVGENTTALFGYGTSTGMQHFTTATTQSGGQVAGPLVVTSLAASSQQIQRSMLCMGFR